MLSKSITEFYTKRQCHEFVWPVQKKHLTQLQDYFLRINILFPGSDFGLESWPATQWWLGLPPPSPSSPLPLLPVQPSRFRFAENVLSRKPRLERIIGKSDFQVTEPEPSCLASCSCTSSTFQVFLY